MSYPPAVYHGEHGEPSAVLRRATTAPALDTMPNNAVHYLATSASTRGEFGLYRWDFGPNRTGPDPHFHRAISESFFVLSGTISLYDGRRWIDGTAGDFLHVPQGGVHGFRNESGEPASMLLLFTPGAPREDYFETLVDVSRSGRTMGEDERAEFMLRHDTFWLD